MSVLPTTLPLTPRSSWIIHLLLSCVSQKAVTKNKCKSSSPPFPLFYVVKSPSKRILPAPRPPSVQRENVMVSSIGNEMTTPKCDLYNYYCFNPADSPKKRLRIPLRLFRRLWSTTSRPHPPPPRRTDHFRGIAAYWTLVGDNIANTALGAGNQSHQPTQHWH